MLNKNKKIPSFNRALYLIVFIILVLSVILSSCFQTPQTQTSEKIPGESPAEGTGSGVSEPEKQTSPEEITGSTTTTTEKIDQEEIIRAFSTLVENNAMPDELIKYIDANLGNADAITMKALLEKLEYAQKKYEEIAMQYLFEGDGQQKLQEAFKSEEELIIENIGRLPDGNFKKDILKMFQGGYKFVNLEGSYYPIIDFEYLKKYSQFLDEEYNDYLDIRATESNWVYSRDAGLTISWEELAKRMINAEKYLVKYTAETPRRIEMGSLFSGYFAAYLYGQNNTPTRDYQTNIVYDEVIQSYEDTIAKNPQSFAVGLISDYLEELRNNDFVLSDNLLKSLNAYINSLIKEYLLDSSYAISEQMKNLNYPSEYAAFGYIRLSDGKYFEEYGSGTSLLIKLSEFFDTGDLNGDGLNDGAAIIIEEPGNESVFYYLHAVYNGGFYIYSIAHSFLGDRVKIRDLVIEEGRIIVEMTVHSQEDPKCCPTEEIKSIFRLDGYDLIEI